MSSNAAANEEATRGAFSSRKVFILAAVGSAVGLGNIWRFPYVAYDSGGGAFLLPYLVALLTAGIPFLFFDYAIGHRYRGSAPLSFTRAGGRKAEGLGWWQFGICFVIAVYYAAVIAWAIRYTFFSVGKQWGEDTEAFFFEDFLQVADGVSLDFVPGVLVPLLIVWLVVLGVLALGVQRGVGASAVVFIPILVVVFGFLVIRALFLPGAASGLEQFFRPDWGALLDASVWAAAYGQIFFSLSIGFGIMITYASYVRRRSDMSGSGLVVGFANSGFELLAGIGVFAVLGFMSQAAAVPVDEVLGEGGVGLAFVAFPAIINEAPAGSLIGLLFFASLILAGLTSLISITEVQIAAVREKFELSRVTATLAVGVPGAVISLLLFSTTTGLPVLDIVDNFINRFGILVVAVASMLVVAWGLRLLPALTDHLNHSGSVPIGTWWWVLVGGLTPAVLTFVLVNYLVETLQEPYGGYPQWMLLTFGWGVAIGVLVLGLLAALAPWKPTTSLEVPPDSPAVSAAGGKEKRP